jgi:sensor histidine kinase YesM
MHRRAPAPATVLAAAAVGSVASVLVLGAILLLQGKSASLVLNRGDVQHRLLAGPLLSGLFALGLVQLARSRERERLAWQQRAAAQLQAERLQRERVQAELQLLQAQLQPHFLYNTLANLRHLVRTDSARALEMLEHLIQYFKLALPSFRVEQVPLHDELALAHSYVALLRERVDQAIELELDRAVELDRLLVPGGAVLCLLENAIKHGLPADPAAARRLRIRAERTAEGLRLTVSDNGPGLATTRGAGTESTGTGLTNLRERLALLHPQRARLRLVDRGDGCDAILDLPVVEP